MWVADKTGLSDTREDLMAQEERFDKQFAETITKASEQDGKDYGSMSFGDLRSEMQNGSVERLEELSEYLQADAKAYGTTMDTIVDMVVTTLEIVGGIIATVLTAGTASPVLAAIISNLIISSAGIALKASALGPKYADNVGTDVVAALTGSALAGFGENQSGYKISPNHSKQNGEQAGWSILHKGWPDRDSRGLLQAL